MKPYDCGCQILGNGVLYCEEHVWADCHYQGSAPKPGPCPDCKWRKRISSIHLSPSAIPTRSRQ